MPRTAPSRTSRAPAGWLALARVYQGQVEGTAEALRAVLDLSPSQRIYSIVTSVERVRNELSAIKDPSRDAIELAGASKVGPPSV